METIIFTHGLPGSKNNFEYLEKNFAEYTTASVELIGFGREPKPRIEYDLDDFLDSLEKKPNLNDDPDKQFVLIGHSMRALLAKEPTIKHPNKIAKAFLLSYPFHDKKEVLRRYSYFDRKYAEGTWWTKMLCQTEIFYKWLFYPYFFMLSSPIFRLVVNIVQQTVSTKIRHVFGRSRSSYCDHSARFWVQLLKMLA